MEEILMKSDQKLANGSLSMALPDKLDWTWAGKRCLWCRRGCIHMWKHTRAALASCGYS